LYRLIGREHLSVDAPRYVVLNESIMRRCREVSRARDLSVLRGSLRNLIVPARSGNMGVAFNRTFFVLTPVWPSQDLPTFSNNCAFLQPVMQGDKAPQPRTTDQQSAGLGNCTKMMWLRCHPVLMGHSRRRLRNHWLGTNILCPARITSSQVGISM
jgi:hypothetical protein